MGLISDPERVAEAMLLSDADKICKYIPSIHRVRDEVFAVIRNHHLTATEYKTAVVTVLGEAPEFGQCKGCNQWFSDKAVDLIDDLCKECWGQDHPVTDEDSITNLTKGDFTL